MLEQIVQYMESKVNKRSSINTFQFDEIPVANESGKYIVLESFQQSSIVFVLRFGASWKEQLIV